MEEITGGPFASAGAAQAFGPLTFAHYRKLLPQASERGPVLALRVGDARRPLGLALGIVEGARARLCSVFVARAHRRGGLATRLLAAFERSAAAVGAVECTTHFGESVDRIAVQRLLNASGWGAPVHVSTIFRSLGADADRFAAAGWDELPPGYATDAWASVSADDRGQIESLIAGDPAMDPNVSPFLRAADVWDPSSLVLRRVGAIVGWMLTRHLGGGVLLFDALYVAPTLRTARLAAPLVLRTVKRGHAAYSADGYAIWWNTRVENQPMMAFNEKRLAEFVSRRTFLYEARKPLPDTTPKPLTGAAPTS